MLFSCRCLVISVLYLSGFSVLAQETNSKTNPYFFIGFEGSIGNTHPANYNFPSTKSTESFSIFLGKSNQDDKLNWKNQLNHPDTGIQFSYMDYGNPINLGQSYSILPFINFRLKNNFSLRFALGASYFNTIYNEISNIDNKAITTNYTWNFRSNIYYDLFKFKRSDLKLSLGFCHNSNGHTKLPNYGLNTFLFGLYYQNNFYNNTKKNIYDSLNFNEDKSVSKYFISRFGLGQNVLNKYSTEKKQVYGYSIGAGFIKNSTFKYGLELYYHFYETYYDYIKNNGALVSDLYPELKNGIAINSSDFGTYANIELLMSHVGIELDLGVNFFKPAYRIDYKLNDGKYINNQYVMPDLDLQYFANRYIFSRLGVNFYALNTSKNPKNNIFLGIHINANFGQANFSELSFGYIYTIKKG